MKYNEIEKYIKSNGLLKQVEPKSGIYAITIDRQIVYVGMSKNIYTRCGQHIYHTQNAMLNKEKKYLLLLAAQLGGHDIDCIGLEYCPEDELREREDRWIELESPILNIVTPSGKNDISELKIWDVLEYVNKRKARTLEALGLTE